MKRMIALLVAPLLIVGCEVVDVLDTVYAPAPAQPTQVYYASAKVRRTDMVKGQAFSTAAYALGCSAGNFAGGQLLGFGVDALLIAGIVMTAIGTLILLATVTKSDIDGGSTR